MERWFILRLLTDEEEPNEDDVSDALSAAEEAANASLLDTPGKFKVGPEIQGYTAKT